LVLDAPATAAKWPILSIRLITHTTNQENTDFPNFTLTIGLGNTLNLILLLDSVRVAGASGGVYNLIGQAFGNSLNIAER
jgi:membrane associated rhomboid family serine protease